MQVLPLLCLLFLSVVTGKEEKKYNYTTIDKYIRWCRETEFPLDYHWLDYLIRIIGLSLMAWQFVMLCILWLMDLDISLDDDGELELDLDTETQMESSSEMAMGLPPDVDSSRQQSFDEMPKLSVKQQMDSGLLSEMSELRLVKSASEGTSKTSKTKS